MVACLLTGCLAQNRNNQTAEGPAIVRFEGSGLRFELHEQPANEPVPTLRVVAADGTDWTDYLTAPEREGDIVVSRLPGRSGLNRLAVENLTYTWTLADGTAMEDTTQYRDVRMRDLEWQMTDADNMLIYHVRPLGRGEEAEWHDLLQWVLDSSGMELEHPLVIWQFPGLHRLNEWQRRGSIEIAGLWHEGLGRMLTSGTSSQQYRETVLVHEFVHAVSPLTGPSWYEEGIAQFYESRFDFERWKGQTQDIVSMRSALKRLQWVAEERELNINEAAYGDETFSPYILGLSFWMFIKHHHGDDQVQALFATDVSGNGLKAELERLFGKELPYVWDDWNAYVRSPDLLADWGAGP